MRLGLAIALTALLPSATSAGPLTGGRLEFSTLNSSPLVFVGDGTSAGTALSAAHVVLSPGSAFADARTVNLPAPPLTGYFVTIGANQAGAFLGIPLADPLATFAARVLLTGFGGAPLLDLAFPIGGTGTQHGTFAGGPLTAEHFPWTSETLAVTGIGDPGLTFTTTGSVQTGVPGRVGLVAATKLTSTVAPPILNSYRLTLDFESVPEPTAGLLLAAGGIALGIAAGTRRAAAR